MMVIVLIVPHLIVSSVVSRPAAIWVQLTNGSVVIDHIWVQMLGCLMVAATTATVLAPLPVD